MILYFLMPLIMVIYLVVCVIKFGWTRSISKTYTYLKGVQKIIPILVLLLGVAIPISILGFNASSNETLKWLWIIAGGVITLVGSAPVLYDKLTEKIHVIGATGGMGLYIFASILNFHDFISLVIMGVYLIFLFTQTARDMLKFRAKGYKINKILKPVFYLAEKVEGCKIKNNTYWIEVLLFVALIGVLINVYL